jgi:hypothetical protein
VGFPLSYMFSILSFSSANYCAWRARPESRRGTPSAGAPVKRSSVSALNLPSVIDEIALEVSELAAAEQTPESLHEAIGDAALTHVQQRIAQRALKHNTESWRLQ